MARGFVYLTAAVDWACRRMLAHRVAITLEAGHAVAVLEQAITKSRTSHSPAISLQDVLVVASDQGMTECARFRQLSAKVERLCRMPRIL